MASMEWCAIPINCAGHLSVVTQSVTVNFLHQESNMIVIITYSLISTEWNVVARFGPVQSGSPICLFPL